MLERLLVNWSDTLRSWLVGAPPVASSTAVPPPQAGPTRDPFRPSTRAQPFFDDKVRAFWVLQSLGWGGLFMLRAISALAGGQSIAGLAPLMVSTLTGFSLSLLLAVVYRQLMRRGTFAAWAGAIGALIASTVVYAFIDASMVAIQPRGEEVAFSTLMLVPLFLNIVFLAGWSALYFAINYFLRVEQQADQLVALESQATASTLAMLRYQINPHFLFNTLNSISTLVLLKQTEPANAMLSRLSSFLRYTLANEPSAMVTLTQEVETLKLYLEIEKMRFEERLRVSFDIDPAAADAAMPSLLLQPVIENAIKYAVTPSEDGADVRVAAHLVGERVRIIVSDTGGGLPPDIALATPSTGVGLANIRDRLAQAYGEEQRFDAGQGKDGGYVVTIELPYRRIAAEALPAGQPRAALPA